MEIDIKANNKMGMGKKLGSKGISFQLLFICLVCPLSLYLKSHRGPLSHWRPEAQEKNK